LGKYRPVHHLPGALAGYSEVHEIPLTRISEAVSKRRLPAEHAADDRPPCAGSLAGRSTSDRRALGRLVHQADVADDHAPAFREFYPGLGLPPGFSGRRRALIERRRNRKFTAERRDHGTRQFSPERDRRARRPERFYFRIAVEDFAGAVTDR